MGGLGQTDTLAATVYTGSLSQTALTRCRSKG